MVVQAVKGSDEGLSGDLVNLNQDKWPIQYQVSMASMPHLFLSINLQVITFTVNILPI